MFQFKKFAIQQDRTPMKVGTDGVLLGSWAELEHATRILDIGTGTGLIALMAAQRNPNALIDALEIEPNACKQARENISASPWPQRITVISQAVQTYTPSDSYDCILCNPPFFRQSTKTPDQGRTLARHDDTLPHPVLVKHASRLLSPQGTFCVILPINEALEMIRLAQQYRLFPQYITRVLPNPEKPPKRYLIQFTFTATTPRTDDLVIELSRHQYSPEYIRLTREFYLNME
ncbi:MAG: methyltransferase [Odoribacter sp.]|nr:methyltransferase [Odoribacter sp.]